MPVTDLTNALAALDAKAMKILGNVACGRQAADAATLSQLDNLATLSARIAYGANHPELLSVTMSRLISWCDHLNELWCVAKFKDALLNDPLPPPPWFGGHG